MRLLVVSHTPHYRRGAEIVGWGPTIRELDQLSTLFDSVVHLAPLYPEPAPGSSLPYHAPNLTFRGVRPSGGDALRDKVSILGQAPAYVQAFVEEVHRCDVVHIRAPASIAMLTMLLLPVVRAPDRRWIKYAGNWSPEGPEPASYRFQRWFLRHGAHRARVTVNGRWPGQPEHVHAFLNPCLTLDELSEGSAVARAKEPPRATRCNVLFVGRADEDKGLGRALDIVELVRAHGIDMTLDVIGDGPERGGFEKRAVERGLPVRFHGWRTRQELTAHYADAHFILLPSTSSEGWPKVLSEAMAAGAVPVCSTVSSVPQYLERFGTGVALPAGDVEAFASAFAAYVGDPARWRRESANAVEAAAKFSYPEYLAAVRDLLEVA